MNPDHEVVQLEQELQKTEDARVIERSVEQRAMWITLSIAIVLVLIVVGFAYSNISYFKSEWTEAKFERSLKQEMELLNPVAAKELHELGQNLMPVYAREVRTQFPEMAPEITAKVKEQLDKVISSVEADTRTRLNDTEFRLREQTVKTIFNAYPGLESEQEQRKLTDRFRSLTSDSVVTALGQFQDRFSPDMELLQRTIFQVPESNESKVDLQKKFIRLWLQLLDEEIAKL